MTQKTVSCYWQELFPKVFRIWVPATNIYEHNNCGLSLKNKR